MNCSTLGYVARVTDGNSCTRARSPSGRDLDKCQSVLHTYSRLRIAFRYKAPYCGLFGACEYFGPAFRLSSLAVLNNDNSCGSKVFGIFWLSFQP